MNKEARAVDELYKTLEYSKCGTEVELKPVYMVQTEIGSNVWMNPNRISVRFSASF